MMQFFQKLRASFLLWLATPVGQQVEKAAWRSLLIFGTSVPFSPTKVWITALFSAVASGIYHSFTAPASDPVKMAALKAKMAALPSEVTPVKTLMLFFLLGAGLVLGDMRPAMAYDWNVRSSSLAVPTTYSVPGAVKALPPGLNEDCAILLPTVALGLGVSKGATNVYGVDLAYDILACHAKDNGDGTASLTSYLGVGGAVFVDAGDWLHSSLKDPVQFRLGLNLIGPKLCGVVPGFNYVWDVRDGSREVILNANVPLGLLTSSTLKKLFKL
jgi:hypothetical protein